MRKKRSKICILNPARHLLEYDDVANEQRKNVYKFRDELLDSSFDMRERVEQNRLAALQELYRSGI